MVLRRQLLLKTSISLIRSLFSVHVSQTYSKTGITSDLTIRIFVRLYKYWQRQTLVLSQSLCDVTYHCYGLCYVKLYKISISSHNAWIDHTVSSSKPPNTLVLGQEIWSPEGFASSYSASRAITENSSDFDPQLWSVPSPYRCFLKVMEQGCIPALLPYSQERRWTSPPSPYLQEPEQTSVFIVL